ncbi:hypothetical protein Dda3937_04618 [Dickeya dadantii 3937]|uniref:Uncharacterized protein n=1 Tax=Dickeya dadantii (strain 3937) TaxID=198628 RepID=E0SGT3_DICD3|nr:hypothetical protein Dda3937_04618 [Dickeya dadantii 3937]
MNGFSESTCHGQKHNQQHNPPGYCRLAHSRSWAISGHVLLRSPSSVTIYTYHSLAVANVLSPEVQLRLTAGHPVFLSITTCRNYRYEKD